MSVPTHDRNIRILAMALAVSAAAGFASWTAVSIAGAPSASLPPRVSMVLPGLVIEMPQDVEKDVCVTQAHGSAVYRWCRFQKGFLHGN